MPFESKSQQRYLFATHPKIAMEFAKKTKNIKALPEKKLNRLTKKYKSRKIN
jgi:hypothetical protein